MKSFFLLSFVTGIIMFFPLACQETTSPDEVLVDRTEITDIAKAAVSKTTEIFIWDVIASGECLGEDLDIYAPYQFTAHTTLDGKGNFHTTMHWRPLRDAIAVGLETGRSWHPVGAEMMSSHSGKVDITQHWVGSGNWFGNQAGPNLFEHWNLSYIVDEDGNVLSVKKEMLSMECHGN